MSTPTPHQTVVEDAAAKIAALEHALELATSRAGSGAEAQADAIIAAARKEAFQLITEARTEAGLVIAEARSEAEHLQYQQPPAAADPATRPDSQGAEALRAEELRLEARIVELQATLAGLESGIRSLTGLLATSSGTQPVATSAATSAAAPPPAFANHPSSQPISLEGEHEAPIGGVANNGGKALVEPLLPPQRTFSASPPPPPSEPEPAPAVLVEDLTVEVADRLEQVPAPEGGSRASFYSRRSAQLPHIGADAGRSAIQAAAGLRMQTGDRVAGKPQA
jgi:cell division septum initiation protein DivIVA